jgi:hypothetical protein
MNFVFQLPKWAFSAIAGLFIVGIVVAMIFFR